MIAARDHAGRFFPGMPMPPSVFVIDLRRVAPVLRMRQTKTRTKILISLALLAASLATSPAFSVPISSRDAGGHIGETVTVKGRASITFMPSGEVYLDLDGQGDGAPLSVYISRWNRPRFRGLAHLDGRMVEISGRIGVFRGRPEIFLQDPGQIAAE